MILTYLPQKTLNYFKISLLVLVFLNHSLKKLLFKRYIFKLFSIKN